MRGNKKAASKATMNLAFRETNVKLLAVIPLLLAVVAGAALIGKFGVADRMAKVYAAEAETAALREQLDEIRASYSDYAEVEAEYNRYTYAGYDRTLADRLDVLALMEREIFPVCLVEQMAVSGQQLSLVLEGLTLESTSALITRLSADELVESVSVSTYTAASASGQARTVTNMTVTLADASLGGNP